MEESYLREDRVNRQRWVFKKHTRNINLLTELALYLKTTKSGVSIEEKNEMYDDFSATSIYNPRKSLRNKPLDAINHKLDGLSFFMFGYSDVLDGQKKFIFSPLGNLYLKYLKDEEALKKIFATMLLGMQFPHPSSRPSLDFKIYPFRLIFQLLSDSRLDGFLHYYEIYNFLIYIDKIDEEIYEGIIADILGSRKISWKEKFEDLKEREHDVVKSAYEWQYYILPLLESIGIINSEKGDISVKLYHPQNEGSESSTFRKINNGVFQLAEDMKRFIEKILENYTIYDEPINLAASNKKSDDIVKEIYSFYPNELLLAIGEPIESLQKEMLELPGLIEEYAHYRNNQTADKFEDILEDAFNMFYNVEAKKISGAGQTDLECLYLEDNKIFAVEAKSTANKLSSINAGRLRRHRELIGAGYTVIVTPRYVPSVKYDIKEQDIVIIKANTLSEYFYNNIISDNREIDYAEIQEIIHDNLGRDISLNISELTLAKFG